MSQIPETANKGLENIVACTSEISTIHDVTLLYRGYTIEDLARHCTFEEVIYLLWKGNLPKSSEITNFQNHLRQHLVLPTNILPTLEAIAHTSAHSMAKLRTAVSHLGLNNPYVESQKPDAVQHQALALTGSMGPLAAAISRFTKGEQPLSARTDQSIAWNILYLIRGQEPSKAEEKIMDTALILHADHELNASAFTARVVASTASDYWSAIVAALSALKGPLHGGANEQVMIMLKEIGSFDHIDQFIEDAVQAKKKVMGIGHRVYKHGDPRAKILKELANQICQTPTLAMYYRMLVRIQEQMELRKGLMPNVDFYSGLVYTALNFQPQDFTPLFAISRITGWTAQILEQYAHNRIYRPRAFYTGPTDLKITPISERI